MNTNDFVYAESLYMHEYTVRIQTLYVWDTKAFPVVQNCVMYVCTFSKTCTNIHTFIHTVHTVNLEYVEYLYALLICTQYLYT